MRKLLCALFVMALSQSALGLRNGCVPGTNGCGDCIDPKDPRCAQDGHLSGHCDLDSNGSSDLLWWDQSTFDVKAWMMLGTARVGDALFLTPRRISSDPNWRIAATGFFDGDNSTDLLWQNLATGELRLWLMNGRTRREEALLFCPTGVVPCTRPSPPWKAVAAGFFGKPQWQTTPAVDGKSDIVFRNDNTGRVMIWIMDGVTVSREVTLASNSTSADPAWRLEGAGFFDTQWRDLYSDLVWHNRLDGRLKIWRMQGASFTEVDVAPREPDTNWRLIGAGEFTADQDLQQHPDLVWRNSQTGQVRVWVMTGTSRGTVRVTKPDGRSEPTSHPVPK